MDDVTLKTEMMLKIQLCHHRRLYIYLFAMPFLEQGAFLDNEQIFKLRVSF